MKKSKQFIACFLFALFCGLISLASFSPVTTIFAEETTPQKINKTVSISNDERDVDVTLNFSTQAKLVGDVNIAMNLETDKEVLKKYQKYAKKQVDSAYVGELIYVTTTPTSEEDKNKIDGSYKFTITLPKFYHNKELAIIPFQDYRSPARIKQLTENDDGTYSFYGSSSYSAYAVVYNGIYKHVIMIGIILLAVLVICVVVKIICLRKDNPEIKERKKQKAIEKKKETHKLNKKLAQELKREKEKLKNKRE